jgi:chromosome partitioning protein
MPTIVFASPKGGVGKSTSAVLLACELAASGQPVTMIDADPNRPVSEWAQRPGRPPSLTVIDGVTEDTIMDTIEEAAKTARYVIVDLEGTASMTVAYAISRADLVIIPSQGSHLDGKQAVKASRLVRRQEQAFKIRIPSAVLLTRTSAAIQTRDIRSIVIDLAREGATVFEVRIVERAAYRALFSYGGTLSTLDAAKVSGVPAAIENAQAFAVETLALLSANAQTREVA